MSNDGWIPYDRDSKRELQIMGTLPEMEEMCWVYDTSYYGVVLANWVGWWETVWGSDDIHVIAWKRVDWPLPPEQLVNAYEAGLDMEEAA